MLGEQVNLLKLGKGKIIVLSLLLGENIFTHPVQHRLKTSYLQSRVGLIHVNYKPKSLLSET